MAREDVPSEPKAYGVRVGAWRLRVLEQGEGTPIVLVHGLGTSASTWRRNLQALSGCGRVYAVDLPGFGESDDPDGIHGAAQQAIVLHAWCRAMGIRRAHFIGHSLGGEVCIWLAIRHPELVDKLVLAGSTGAPVRSNHLAKLARLLRDGLREPLSFMPVLLRAYAQAGPWRIGHTALRWCRSPRPARWCSACPRRGWWWWPTAPTG
jgi:pimeloyl-ACP methyl ester carboxylesterase